MVHGPDAPATIQGFFTRATGQCPGCPAIPRTAAILRTMRQRALHQAVEGTRMLPGNADVPDHTLYSIPVLVSITRVASVAPAGAVTTEGIPTFTLSVPTVSVPETVTFP